MRELIMPWDLATYIPLAVLYAFIAWRLVRLVLDLIPADEIWTTRVALVCAAVVSSGATILLGEMWAILVEIIRVSDGHLGNRTQLIPYLHQRAALFALGIVTFLTIAVLQRRNAGTSAPPAPRGWTPK